MNGTLARPNANPILAVMRDDDFTDPWGTAMAWGFGVCEVLTFHGEDVPALDYRPSPYVDHSQPVFEDYPDAYIFELTNGTDATDDDIAALQAAARCLKRYLDWCVAAGLDY